MSYVEILVLRHLSARPAHGYELRKRVEQTAGVTLHNNSLYPALKRFEEAGAVSRTSEPSENGRPPRQVYALTPVGRELLHDMLADLPPDAARDDNEFLARVGQFSLLSAPERLAVLDARELAQNAALQHFRNMHSLAGDEPWGQVATAELIRRTEAELAWIAELREKA
ncbi:MAG: PadR family transcriptional regulator [Streptosporangiaceae bacterium]